MDFDLDDIKRLAGVDNPQQSYAVEQPFNPRKMVVLAEQIRRATPEEARNKIDNWKAVGHLSIEDIAYLEGILDESE